MVLKRLCPGPVACALILIGLLGGAFSFTSLLDAEARVFPLSSERPPGHPSAGSGWGPVPITRVSAPIAGEEVITQVYEKAYPAVVNIVATTLEMNFWMDVIPRSGQGSGFIIDPRGYILTNNHVVEEARDLEVTMVGGKKVKAVLVGRDPVTDLAIIKIPPPRNLRVATLGDSDKLRVGQMAIAIGNPFGLEHTVTVGVISALNRQLATTPGTELSRVIQTDASINPGNSGGPLLNSRGEVIGINTAIFSTSGGAQGIGFAIPINTAKQVAQQLIEKGKVARPWLGIASAFTLNPELAEALKLPVRQGVVVAQVYRAGPAEKAGVRGGNRWVVVGVTRILIGGDIIVGLGGEKISSLEDLIGAVRQRLMGSVVSLEVVRSGRRVAMNVRLEEAPAER
ncbi:MAG TPA: trypsin-like peptidase domain-containing protein [bacterium]|nr:trypsin-like peptidase domain-containing protein [bacterium]